MKKLKRRTKRIVLRIIVILILLSMVLFLNGQTSAYSKTIYRDFGTFKVVSGQNVVSISAFATIEKVDPATHFDEVIPNNIKPIKEQKNVVPEKLYHYELYLVSKSIFEGDTTSTWLYRTRIFISGVDMLLHQFPDGFVASISTIPTLIYTYHSIKPDVEFEIKWEKSVYEPRIRK